MFTQKEFTSSTKVKVTEPGDPPTDIEWVRDIHINGRTRRQLTSQFWKQHRGIIGQVSYVSSESQREKLRREGKVMVHVSDPSAQSIVLIIPVKYLTKA